MRPSVPLALGMVMLMAASAAAHGRAFIGARVGVPVHPITVAPPAVVASPGFVTISSFPIAPRVPLVITPRLAIRPGPLVIVRRPSATFLPQTVFVSPPVQGAFSPRVTGPPRGVVPKVILVGPTGSTRQR
jgi:hypothetical protein